MRAKHTGHLTPGVPGGSIVYLSLNRVRYLLGYGARPTTQIPHGKLRQGVLEIL